MSPLEYIVHAVCIVVVPILEVSMGPFLLLYGPVVISKISLCLCSATLESESKLWHLAIHLFAGFCRTNITCDCEASVKESRLVREDKNFLLFNRAFEDAIIKQVFVKQENDDDDDDKKKGGKKKVPPIVKIIKSNESGGSNTVWFFYYHRHFWEVKFFNYHIDNVS